MALFTKLPSWASILITVIAAIIVVGLVSWGTYTLVKPSPEESPEVEEVILPEEEPAKELPEEIKKDLSFKYSDEQSERPIEVMGVVKKALEANAQCDRYVKLYLVDDKGFAQLNGIEKSGEKDKEGYSSNEKKYIGRKVRIKGVYGFTPCEALCVCDPYINIEEIEIIEDEFADWQTYRNEEYGFEVKYPGDYNLVENSQISEIYLKKNSKIEISIRKVIDSTAKYYKCFVDGPFNISIGEIKAEKYIWNKGYTQGRCEDIEKDYPQNTPTTVVLIARNNIFYEIFFYNTKDLFGKNNQILSSFKFLGCEDQPILVGIGFKDNPTVNVIFRKENDKLLMISENEWHQKNYKQYCVKQYYIEEDIPSEILDNLFENNILKKRFSNIASWQVYSDKNLGIEFKYPPEWKVSKSQPGETHIESLVPYGSYMSVLGPLTIWIDRSTSGANWGMIDKIETIIINDKKVLLTTRGSATNIYYTVKLSDGFHNFYLKYTPSQQGSLGWDKDYHLSVFATVLSTFKFLE